MNKIRKKFLKLFQPTDAIMYKGVACTITIIGREHILVLGTDGKERCFRIDRIVSDISRRPEFSQIKPKAKK